MLKEIPDDEIEVFEAKDIIDLTRGMNNEVEGSFGFFNTNMSIMDIVNYIYRYLNVPIRFYDSSMNILIEIGKELPNKWLKEKDMVKILTQYEIEVISDLIKSKKPYYSTTNEGNFLLYAAGSKETLIGILSCYRNGHNFTKKEIGFLMYMGNMILIQLARNKFKANRAEDQFENFILGLLTKEISKENSRISKYQEYTFYLNKYIKLYILKKSEKKNLNHNLLKILLSTLSNMYIVVSFEDKIIIVQLFSSSSKQDNQDNIKCILNKYAPGQLVVMSETISSVFEIQENYEKIKKIFNYDMFINISQCNFVNYSDFKLTDFLIEILDRVEWKKYTHNSIKLLQEYDIKFSTEYVQTLYNYLLCDKELLKTSKKMHYHRNTIQYRLDKIKDIANIDFNNFEELFHISLSFKLLDIFNKIRESDTIVEKIRKF